MQYRIIKYLIGKQHGVSLESIFQIRCTKGPDQIGSTFCCVLERQQGNVEWILGQTFLCQIFIHFKKWPKHWLLLQVFYIFFLIFLNSLNSKKTKSNCIKNFKSCKNIIYFSNRILGLALILIQNYSPKVNKKLSRSDQGHLSPGPG